MEQERDEEEGDGERSEHGEGSGKRKDIFASWATEASEPRIVGA